MSSLDQLYVQCHEHLRDADKKRDELIGFYAVVIGLLFAAYGKIGDGLKPLVTCAVALVGVFVVLSVIQYRKWHSVLASCFQTLQVLQRLPTEPSTADVLAAWEKFKPPLGYWRQWRLLNPLAGTEAATFGALLVLTYVPWHLLITTGSCRLCFPVSGDLAAFMINLVLYIVVVAASAAVIFCLASRKGPFDHWPLSSLDPP